MLFASIIIVVGAIFRRAVADDLDYPGYHLPANGTASLTPFYIGPGLANGTACGVSGMPYGKRTSGTEGGGPGYLYAGINQLAFGSNPSVAKAGGPGAACGLCYWITPKNSSGVYLTENALIFKIVEECAAAVKFTGSSLCSACTTTETNDLGHTWHFIVAVDAMSTIQYNQFFKGTSASSWNDIAFEETACGVDSPAPSLKSWGCISGCSNNDHAGVCDGTNFS